MQKPRIKFRTLRAKHKGADKKPVFSGNRLNAVLMMAHNKRQPKEHKREKKGYNDSNRKIMGKERT